jgi:phosphonate transport system substrate-binding protein
MNPLVMATAQSDNTVRVSSATAAFLTNQLGMKVAFADELRAERCYRSLDAGTIHLCWICGLPYVKRADQSDSPIHLLVAPVMAGERYGGRPIYFSDVIVRKDNAAQSFADLRGASWAYNDAGSHSGYCVVRDHVGKLGVKNGYFGRLVASGAHLRSLQMVLSGEVDASAIDSTVLDWELNERPALQEQIRIVEVIGPSPIPPLVVLEQVERETRENIRSSLLGMHETQRGRKTLELGLIERFVAVKDEAYDPIRVMSARADSVSL